MAAGKAGGWRTRGNVFVALCTAIAMGVSLYLIRDIAQDGLPRGTDMGAHVVRADIALDRFFAGGRLDGWQDRFGLGYQQSLFLGPGFNLLVGLIKLLSLGTLSTVGAVKAAIVVSYVAMPPAVATLAWAYGLGRRTIGVAAILSLGVTVSLGGAGLAGLFTWALVPNALGAVLTVLGAAAVARTIRRPSMRRVLAAAVCLALVVLTHPWAAIALVLFALCFGTAVGLDWMVTHRPALRAAGVWAGLRTVLRAVPDGAPVLTPDPAWRAVLGGPVRRVKALAVAAALGVALAGVQVIPLLAHRDLKGEDASFADAPIGERLATALKGTDFLRPYVMTLIIAGLAYAILLAVARRPFALPLVVTPLLYIAVARIAARLFPDSTVAVQLMNRSLFLVGFLGVLAAATLIGELGPTVASARTIFGSRRPRPVGDIRPLGALVLMAVPLAVVLVPEPPRLEKAETVAPAPALVEAAAELGRRVPDTGRYVMQVSDRYDQERSGLWQPAYWLAWASGRRSLNNYNLESSIVTGPLYEGDHLTKRSPEAEVDELQRDGVTHLLLFEPEAVGDLLAHRRVRVVWRGGGMAIAELLDDTGEPSPVPVVSGTERTRGRVLRADPEHPAFEVVGDHDRVARLALAWSPKWRARVNGEPVELGRDGENRATVILPAGPATLELDFGADGADGLGLAVTLAALVLVGALATRRRWRLPGVGRLVDRIVAVVEPAPPPDPAAFEPTDPPGDGPPGTDREPVPGPSGRTSGEGGPERGSGPEPVGRVVPAGSLR